MLFRNFYKGEMFMSKRKVPSKHKHNKIRGSNKIFVNSNFEKSFERLFVPGSIVCHDYLDAFRQNEKEVVAVIERMAANKIDNGIVITNESLQVIVNNMVFPNPYELGFINCVINYFNDRNSNITIINYKLNNKSKRYNKIMQHAYKDCQKSVESYVNKILWKMKNGAWTNISHEDILKFEAINPAVEFFCNYTSFLLNEDLPKKIDKKSFLAAQKYDENLINYYNNSEFEEEYTLIEKKNNKTKKVTQECATYLFCKNINT